MPGRSGLDVLHALKDEGTAMRVLVAGDALLLDVGQLSTRGQLAIPPDDAPAGERPKSQEPHETHDQTSAGPFSK